MAEASTPPAPPGPAAKADEPSDVRSVHTTSLPELLDRLGISLLITTYQAGKLIAVRVEEGRTNVHLRNFHTPMGMALRGNRLAIGTFTHIWEYYNQTDVAAKLRGTGPANDACFVPRHAHVTGNIGVHELAFVGDELWIVNTRFSCLCTLAPDVSFVPRWRPPFVSGLAPEDRCHLNGFGVRDGRIRYATALGDTDTPGGWRANKAKGGLLLDVPTSQPIIRGLSMPHSPRWYGDRLWLLESGAGSLSVVNEATGGLEVVALLPGFTRGLDFYGPYAFIGLSQVRETAIFSGIPITERLTVEQRCCGMWVVDVRTGETVAFMRFEAGVQEVFAVQVLTGVRFPEILTEGVNDEILANAFVLPDAALADVQASTAETEV